MLIFDICSVTMISHKVCILHNMISTPTQRSRSLLHMLSYIFPLCQNKPIRAYIIVTYQTMPHWISRLMFIWNDTTVWKSLHKASMIFEKITNLYTFIWIRFHSIKLAICAYVTKTPLFNIKLSLCNREIQCTRTHRNVGKSSFALCLLHISRLLENTIGAQ